MLALTLQPDTFDKPDSVVFLQSFNNPDSFTMDSELYFSTKHEIHIPTKDISETFSKPKRSSIEDKAFVIPEFKKSVRITNYPSFGI